LRYRAAEAGAKAMGISVQPLGVRDGGLMSYGPDLNESFARVADLIDRILKGAKPAKLPFDQPTLFRFVLNVNTAKSLGLTVPPTLLVRADDIIE
jgi:putative tryptophan/tyrosine transport system substrate-binding protein